MEAENSQNFCWQIPWEWSQKHLRPAIGMRPGTFTIRNWAGFEATPAPQQKDKPHPHPEWLGWGQESPKGKLGPPVWPQLSFPTLAPGPTYPIYYSQSRPFPFSQNFHPCHASAQSGPFPGKAHLENPPRGSNATISVRLHDPFLAKTDENSSPL